MAKQKIINIIDRKEIISKFKSRSIPCQSVTINTVNPKVYKFSQGSNGLNNDTAIYHLLHDETRAEVFASLRDITFVEEVIKEVSSSKSGIIKTKNALISFDLLQTKISAALSKYGASNSQRTLTVLDGFFVEAFRRLDIITNSSSIETFEYDNQFFLSEERTLEEMKKSRLAYTLGLFDMSKIEAKREVGIAAIASEISSQAYSMETSLISLKSSASELATVLSLIEMYVTNDHTAISEDESTIFEDEKFLSLAHNLSFIKMALDTTKSRPKSSYNFWQRAIDRVDSAIKSSSLYSTVEIKAIKEHFSTTIQLDRDGLKQGIIVSRNLVEAAPLEIFHKMSDTLSTKDGMWRLIEDPITERYMDGAYSAAKQLRMIDIHRFAEALHTAIVLPEHELFTSVFGVSYDDLVYLAVANGAKLEIIIDDDIPVVDRRKLCFRLDTDNSKLRVPVANFMGTVKTNDPLFALIVVSEDYDGKITSSCSDPLIDSAKNKMFTKLGEFMDNRFQKASTLKLKTSKQAVTIPLMMEDLLATTSLQNCISVNPLQGAIIYEALFNFFQEINAYNLSFLTKDEQIKDSFNMNACLLFVNLLKPILNSTDVQDMSYTTKGLIATKLEKDGLSRSEGRSYLTDHRVETEININMGLIFLNKLGFVKTQARLTEALKIFENANVFSQLGLLVKDK